MTSRFLVSTALALVVVVPAPSLVAQDNARPSSAASARFFSACVAEVNVGSNSPVYDPTYLAPASFPQSPLSVWRCSRANDDLPTWNGRHPQRSAQLSRDSAASRRSGVASAEQGLRKPSTFLGVTSPGSGELGSAKGTSSTSTTPLRGRPDRTAAVTTESTANVQTSSPMPRRD